MPAYYTFAKHFYQNPKPGEVYNAGGGRFSNCSMIEAIESCEKISGNKMNFRLEFTPKPFDIKINHQQNLLLIGSCFTEQIGSKLSNHKFSVLDNPNGILFNPVSIYKSISSYINNKQYKEADLLDRKSVV